jgi:hypothetical protein
MTLQEKVIKTYQRHYPKHSLRQISHHTGIQLTRVFRLFNGSPMKLEEYERFKEVLELSESEIKSDSLLVTTAKELQKTLNENSVRKVMDFMIKQIHLHSLVVDPIIQSENKQIIA